MWCCNVSYAWTIQHWASRGQHLMRSRFEPPPPSQPPTPNLCEQESTPFAVIGSNTVVEARGQRVRGRLYPWGIVEGTFTCPLILNVSFGHAPMLSMLCFCHQWKTSHTVILSNWGTCWSAHTCTTSKTWPVTSIMRTTERSAYRRWPGTWEQSRSLLHPGFYLLHLSPVILFILDPSFFSVNWLRTTTWRVPSPSCRSQHTMGRLRNSSKVKTRR